MSPSYFHPKNSNIPAFNLQKSTSNIKDFRTEAIKCRLEKTLVLPKKRILTFEYDKKHSKRLIDPNRTADNFNNKNNINVIANQNVTDQNRTADNFNKININIMDNQTENDQNTKVDNYNPEFNIQSPKKSIENSTVSKFKHIQANIQEYNELSSSIGYLQNKVNYKSSRNKQKNSSDISHSLLNKYLCNSKNVFHPKENSSSKIESHPKNLYTTCKTLVNPYQSNTCRIDPGVVNKLKEKLNNKKMSEYNRVIKDVQIFNNVYSNQPNYNKQYS